MKKSQIVNLIWDAIVNEDFDKASTAFKTLMESVYNEGYEKGYDHGLEHAETWSEKFDID